MTKVAFLGASLTAQHINHKDKKPTGYCYFLEKYLCSSGISDVRRFTYPGARFEFGAWINLDKIIEYKPDCIFLELCVEDGSNKNQLGERLKDYYFFLRKLVEEDICPALLLIKVDDASADVAKALKNLTRKINIPACEASKEVIENMSGKFNGVHTTTLSAALLANEWKDFIYETLEKRELIIGKLRETMQSFELKTPKYSRYITKNNIGNLKGEHHSSLNIFVESMIFREGNESHLHLSQSLVNTQE